LVASCSSAIEIDHPHNRYTTAYILGLLRKPLVATPHIALLGNELGARGLFDPKLALGAVADHVVGHKGEEAVRISGRLKSNNGNFRRIAVIKGEGISVAPTLLVGEDLAAGQLIPLLPDYPPVASDLSIVYPASPAVLGQGAEFCRHSGRAFCGRT